MSNMQPDMYINSSQSMSHRIPNIPQIDAAIMNTCRDILNTSIEYTPKLTQHRITNSTAEDSTNQCLIL